MKTAWLGLLWLCATACGSGPPEVPALYISESGFRLTRGATPDAEGCGPLSGQWELTSYDVTIEARSPSGISLSGPLDGDRVDGIADAVEACLVGLGSVADVAWCLWPRQVWGLARECSTVLAVPGVRACTADLWLLPDDARGSCDQWMKEDSACKCRWAVATQDAGRTAVVPEQAPYGRLAEALVRMSTGCAFPWLDPGLAECSSL